MHAAGFTAYPGSYGSESFTYDRVGNRKTHQTRQGENHTYVVDAADQLTEIRDTNTSALLYSFTHDAAGRRTGMTPSVGPSTSYQYDARGKLTRLTRSDGYSVRLAYGPHGGRYRRKETGFPNAYYLNAWAEHRSDQAVRLVRAGPGGAVVAEISGGMVRGLVRDGLANASHVTVGGTLASVRRYGGFGDILSGPPYPFVERGFAGQQREGRSGLVYMRARHYDPITGRFLQADPLGINADQLYAYAASNPYRFFDPLGLGPISYAEPSSSAVEPWHDDFSDMRLSPAVSAGDPVPDWMEELFPAPPASGTEANLSYVYGSAAGFTYQGGVAYVTDASGNRVVYDIEAWGGASEIAEAGYGAGTQVTNANDALDLAEESTSIGFGGDILVIGGQVEFNFGHNYTGRTYQASTSAGFSPVSVTGLQEEWTPRIVIPAESTP